MSTNVNLFIYINQHLQNPILDMVMPTLTHFGGFIFLLLIVLVMLIYAKLAKKDNLKKVAFIALIALLFTDLIALILKYTVQEPRPFLSLDNVRVLVQEDDIFSFPSGHACSTWAVISIFIINIGSLVKKHHWVVISALVVFGVLILFSRVYCGVHYPWDVLAGALIGIFGGLLVNKFKDEILTLVSRFI